MKTETKTIEYLGETLESKWFINDVTKEEIQLVQENFYQFDNEKYEKQLETVLNGGTTKGWVINHINSKHFDKIMNDTKLYHSKWTVNEMLENEDLVSYFIARTKSNPKVFNKDLVSNVKTAIRLGGKGVSAKPTNFPIKEGVKLLNKYTEHLAEQRLTHIDLTSGWGDRLLATVKSNMRYIGLDINPFVVNASNSLVKDIVDSELMPKGVEAHVLFKDATVTIKELVNKADIIMTSPPYFYLEEYKGEKQATRADDFKGWLENFVEPFMKNAYLYLKENRFALINVTNYKNYDLVKGFKEAGIKAGFEFKGYDGLKNIKRTNSKGGFNNNSEDVLVFYKN